MKGERSVVEKEKKNAGAQPISVHSWSRAFFGIKKPGCAIQIFSILYTGLLFILTFLTNDSEYVASIHFNIITCSF